MWEGEEGVRPKPHPEVTSIFAVLERTPTSCRRRTQSHERNAQDEVREGRQPLKPVFTASVLGHNFYTPQEDYVSPT
jgi:hypothetical protein